MKYSLLLFLVLFSKCLLAQNLKLNNAIIIAQFEKEEDRYAMQAMLSELFKANQSLPMKKTWQINSLRSIKLFKVNKSDPCMSNN